MRKFLFSMFETILNDQLYMMLSLISFTIGLFLGYANFNEIIRAFNISTIHVVAISLFVLMLYILIYIGTILIYVKYYRIEKYGDIFNRLIYDDSELSTFDIGLYVLGIVLPYIMTYMVGIVIGCIMIIL